MKSNKQNVYDPWVIYKFVLILTPFVRFRGYTNITIFFMRVFSLGHKSLNFLSYPKVSSKNSLFKILIS